MYYYLIYKKNMRMVPSKVAYEVMRLSLELSLRDEDKVAVLGVSTTKFNKLLSVHTNAIQRSDKSSVVTCAAISSEITIKL